MTHWQQYCLAVMAIGVGGFGLKAAWKFWNQAPGSDSFPWMWLCAKAVFETLGFGFSGASLVAGLLGLADLLS